LSNLDVQYVRHVQQTVIPYICKPFLEISNIFVQNQTDPYGNSASFDVPDSSPSFILTPFVKKTEDGSGVGDHFSCTSSARQICDWGEARWARARSLIGPMGPVQDPDGLLGIGPKPYGPFGAQMNGPKWARAQSPNE
jgi:hypothetical protein